VGVLDAIAAMAVAYAARAVPPARVWQSVAAGLLGRDAAARGGLATALLGLGLHFFIAFTVAAVYLGASRRVGILTRRPVVCGVVYGVCVFFFMNQVVIPLSAIGRGGFPALPALLRGLIVHALFVGLPAALAARRARNPLRAESRSPARRRP
jgi:hypothetical protein